MGAPLILDMPMGGGLAQRTAAPHVPLGDFVQAVNVRQNKNLSVSKRPGNVKLTSQIAVDPNFGSGTQSIDASLGGALSAHGSQLVLTTNAGVSSYSAAWSAFDIPRPGSEALVKRTSVSMPPVILANTIVAPKMPPAIITDGTHYFYCWVSNGGTTYVTIEEIASGALVQDLVQPNPGATTHVWAVPILLGTSLVIVWQDSSQNIKFATMPTPYTGSFSGATGTLRTDAKVTFCPHDVVVNGTDFTLAYADNASHLKWHNFNSAGTPLTSATATPTHSPRDIRLSLFGTTLYTVFSYDTAAFACLLSAKTWSTLFDKGTAIVVEAVSTFQISVLGISATRAVVAYSASNSGTYTAAALVDTSGGTFSLVIDGTSNRLNHTLLLSKPFAQGGKYYFWVQAYTDTTSFTATEYAIKNPSQWTNVLVDSRLDVGATGTDWPSRPVAVDAPRFALPLQSRSTTDYPDRAAPLNVVQPSANQWVAMAGIHQTAIASMWARLSADFASPARWRTATLGTLSLQSSGMCMNWDGTRSFEQGFLNHVINVTSSQTLGSGLTASSNYYYRVVPVGFDAAGNIHRGFPSPLFLQATPAATNLQITLVIASQQLTDRSPLTGPTSTVAKYPLYWEIYRSQPTPGSVGTDIATNFVDIVVNNFQANTVTYVDAKTDATIAVNATCYTFGGALPNGCPPGALDIVAHQGRAWIISDDGSTLYYSKQIVDGEAVNFTDSFTFPTDVQCTALASMDDKLIIFADREIYYLTGHGPGDDGSGNDYQNLERIQSDVGCIDRRSTVSLPEGILFQSHIGLYILTRALEVVYIGQPVADELAAYPVVTSAVLHPSQPWVYITVTDSAGSTGERIVYDYRVQKWYTDTLPTAAISATRAGSDYYWLAASGQVWKEDASVGTDDGVYVNSKVKTGHLRPPTTLQGWASFEQMQLLYSRASACDITITTTLDYKDTREEQTQLFWDKELEGFEIEQLGIVTSQREMESIQITIQDTAPLNPSGGVAPPVSDDGKGVTYFGLSMLFDAPEKLYDLDDSQVKG